MLLRALVLMLLALWVRVSAQVRRACANMHKHTRTGTNMHEYAQTCTNMFLACRDEQTGFLKRALFGGHPETSAKAQNERKSSGTHFSGTNEGTGIYITHLVANSGKHDPQSKAQVSMAALSRTSGLQETSTKCGTGSGSGRPIVAPAPQMPVTTSSHSPLPLFSALRSDPASSLHSRMLAWQAVKDSRTFVCMHAMLETSHPAKIASFTFFAVSGSSSFLTASMIWLCVDRFAPTASTRMSQRSKEPKL